MLFLVVWVLCAVKYVLILVATSILDGCLWYASVGWIQVGLVFWQGGSSWTYRGLAKVADKWSMVY